MTHEHHSQQASLDEDVWDLRALGVPYNAHRSASEHVLSFAGIANVLLKRQIKEYFRQRLPQWTAKTCSNVLSYLSTFIKHLPPDISIDTLTPEHIESTKFLIQQDQPNRVGRTCGIVRTMLNYMRHSNLWDGVRPPENVIRACDTKRPESPLARFIPPEVLDRVDELLQEAEDRMDAGQPPRINPPAFWNALRILRETGARINDILRLPTPDAYGRHGCLDQDAQGDWWLIIHAFKVGKTYTVPLTDEDGVLRAIHRQREHAQELRAQHHTNVLFCGPSGAMLYATFLKQLHRLAPYTPDEGRPYTINPHDFRDTVATERIEYGMSLRMTGDQLGQSDLATTSTYIALRKPHLRAAYTAYCDAVYPPPSSARTRSPAPAQRTWSIPLPGNLGVCVTRGDLPPHCDTCSLIWCARWRADGRHLAALQRYADQLQQTIDLLTTSPKAAPAREQYQRHLQRTTQIIDAIIATGGWDGTAVA